MRRVRVWSKMDAVDRGVGERPGVDDARLAFEHFFRTEYVPVMNTVSFIVRDSGRAEEITQDAFVKVFDHWGRVAAYDRPDAWVRRVAVRMAIRSVRRERMRFRLETQTVPRAADPPGDVDVLRAIAQLPPRQRAAATLFYFEDRPVAEIGDLLRCSTATVKVHLHKARKRLAELLREEVADDVG
jgi:RNA polymerase sigma factor (sigma-70 family)